jgi:hypothetical protein
MRKYHEAFAVLNYVRQKQRNSCKCLLRYIGGCCGFEAYHIRAISEELSKERGGKVSQGSEKHDLWGGGLVMHTKPWVRARFVFYYSNEEMTLFCAVLQYLKKKIAIKL